MSLSRKVSLLVLLNLAAIALLLFVFLQAQFGLDPETLLAGPVRERVLATGVQVSREIEASTGAERPAILRRYERDLQVELFLIAPVGGLALDGKPAVIPQAVLERMHPGRPEQAGGRPPPPPEDDPPCSDGNAGAGPSPSRGKRDTVSSSLVGRKPFAGLCAGCEMDTISRVPPRTSFIGGIRKPS